MDSKIIDGKKLALKRQEKLIQEVKKLEKTPKIVSILVGDDAPSVLYTNIKQKKASELGIIFQPLYFNLPPQGWTHKLFEEVVNKIKELNRNPEIDGIMVQLPLPKLFLQNRSEKELLEFIDDKKDVDGLNYAHQTSSYVPAAVKAVLSILKDERIPVAGKKVVVVGSSDLIGKPVAEEMEKLGAKVIICDRQTTDLCRETLKADILISATGVPGLIKGNMISDGVVIIDVGAEKVDGKIMGDVDFKSVYPKALRITPVPGGVGPMTVISLMENTVKATCGRIPS